MCYIPDLWSNHLPFLYSCISFLGVLMLLGKKKTFYCYLKRQKINKVFLLVCTPLGFVRLFDIVGQFLIKPHFLRDINEEYFTYAFEEECLRRRLKHAQTTNESYVSPFPMAFKESAPVVDDYHLPNSLLRLRNGELQIGLSKRLTDIETKRRRLGKRAEILNCRPNTDELFSDKQRQTSSLRRNLFYPIAMILLLSLTVITVLIVIQNTIELLIGIKALPLSSRVIFISSRFYFQYRLFFIAAIHTRHNVFIDVRTIRSGLRNRPNFIFDRNIFHRAVHIAVNESHPAEAEKYALQPHYR